MISNKKTLLELVFLHICNAIAITTRSTGTSANHLLMIMITKACLFLEIFGPFAFLTLNLDVLKSVTVDGKYKFLKIKKKFSKS